ncbi:alpha/beta hydrolase family protein [Lapillicoccus jejuensis]|uniref:Prolyl oligopeptidase family protein n=1 Tax=Lapillicoccus jejuensis TaxID=402171 RepID=A0A542DXW6_9MICO|nr:prolyl oligopeptidase family serine peptidase [Lapillicoccus jejuensis]TQJ07916.1 prolyl oligopeptidase family protein [Lapillicoccus jejuensis]
MTTSPELPGIPTAGVPAPARTTAYGDDPAQVYDVRLPTGEPRGATVVVVHGGFWRAAFDRHHAAPQAQAFADRGYHVAVLEYRRVSMPGGGWPGTVDDVLAAVAAVRDDADLPEPTVLVGHSAGGHLVALAASRTSAWGLRGAVSLAGCVDLRRGVELGMGDGAVHDLLGAEPAQDPADPLAAADPSMTVPVVPVVLVHGDADDVVPLEVSRSYLARVDAADGSHAPVRLVVVPGADHGAVVDPAHPAFAVVADEVAALLA